MEREEQHVDHGRSTGVSERPFGATGESAATGGVRAEGFAAATGGVSGTTNEDREGEGEGDDDQGSDDDFVSETSELRAPSGTYQFHYVPPGRCGAFFTKRGGFSWVCMKKGSVLYKRRCIDPRCGKMVDGNRCGTHRTFGETDEALPQGILACKESTSSTGTVSYEVDGMATESDLTWLEKLAPRHLEEILVCKAFVKGGAKMDGEVLNVAGIRAECAEALEGSRDEDRPAPVPPANTPGGLLSPGVQSHLRGEGGKAVLDVISALVAQGECDQMERNETEEVAGRLVLAGAVDAVRGWGQSALLRDLVGHLEAANVRVQAQAVLMKRAMTAAIGRVRREAGADGEAGEDEREHATPWGLAPFLAAEFAEYERGVGMVIEAGRNKNLPDDREPRRVNEVDVGGGSGRWAVAP